MIFLSPTFIVGYIALFLLYWTFGAGSQLRQNMLLLVAGVLFYGWIDLYFVGLVLFSAGANLALGIAMSNTADERWQRLCLWSGVALNIGLLGWFKYFGFFHDAFSQAFALNGTASHLALTIALPLGISYWTFQLTGYLIDVYNGTITACRKPLPFFTYVLYFPKMLAGPVERAQHFLPRIAVARTFSHAEASDGMRQIIWGVFAKLVIADNCAALVDSTFTMLPDASGSTLLLGAFLYLVQVYSDFSGYSNMAIGLSKLLGIPLMANFRTPLFTTDIGGFWRSWHISLTTWMMDYVFTPLNFLLRSRGKLGLALSIFITFLAVGIWHGANWTFILFGVLQGLYFLPLVFKGALIQNRTGPATYNKVGAVFAMVGMVLLMSLTFVLLRCGSVHEAWTYWQGIPVHSLFSRPTNATSAMVLMLLFFFTVEWIARDREFALAAPHNRTPLLVRWSWLALVIFLTGMYMASGESAFLYFSF